MTVHSFNFPLAGGDTSPIRVAMIAGAPWFFITDVCIALGFKVKPCIGRIVTSNVINRLDACEIASYSEPGRRGAPFKVLSVKGVYQLLIRTNKGGADFMRAWIDRDVLPRLPTPTDAIEERLEHAKQAMRDALHVLDRNIEDMQEHRARIREALVELQEVTP